MASFSRRDNRITVMTATVFYGFNPLPTLVRPLPASPPPQPPHPLGLDRAELDRGPGSAGETGDAHKS